MSLIPHSEIDHFLKTRFADYIKAVDGIDTTHIASFYDPNGTLVHRDKNSSHGREAIKAVFDHFVSTLGKAVNTFTDLKVRGVDEYIILEGRYKIVGEKGAQFTGEFLQIYRKVNGTYLIYHDEFSIDK